jgi:hypothetical protein
VWAGGEVRVGKGKGTREVVFRGKADTGVKSPVAVNTRPVLPSNAIVLAPNLVFKF